MRTNFAKQIKDNIGGIQVMTDFELDLMHALYDRGILDDRIDQINALFAACDI